MGRLESPARLYRARPLMYEQHMRSTLKIAALAALTCLALTTGARARPYLMLHADDQGFTALDLGDIHPNGDVAQATLILAPLAGAPYADKVAPLVKQKIEVACQVKRWRVVSATYTDASEVVLARDDNAGDWVDFEHDEVKSLVQSAACLKLYSQNLVSRRLNIGEVLAGFQAAHSKAPPEPKTDQQLLAERAKAAR